MSNQKQNQKNELDLGEMAKRAAYPAEFLEGIADEAENAMRKWLVENGTPQMVVDLLSSTLYLKYLEMQHPDNFPGGDRERWNAEIRETVSVMAWGIKAIGGNFWETPGRSIQQ